MFSTARIGWPAVTCPRIGIFSISWSEMRPSSFLLVSSIIFKALVFAGSFEISPSDSRLER